MSTTTSQLTIMILADRSDRAAAVRAVLQGAGYQVLVTDDINAGLVAFDAQAPHLAVLVHRSPADVLTALRRAVPEAPVLAVVPAVESTVAAALSSGATDCLREPVLESLLLTRVRLLLRDALRADTSDDGLRQSIFDNANDAIFIEDLRTGRFLDVNKQALRWLGYSRDELLAMRFSDIRDTEQRADSDEVKRDLTTRGKLVFEDAYRAQGGHVIPVEVSSRIVRFNGQRAVANFARNISERHAMQRAERKQRRLAEGLARAAADLTSTLRLSEVVERILAQVETVVPSDAANIMLLDGGRARVIGKRGYEAHPEDGGLMGSYIVDETATLRWVIEYKRPLVLPDVKDQPDLWTPSSATRWIRSYIAAPIWVQDEIIAILNLDDARPGRFSVDHANTLQAFCDIASIAIRNALLYQSVQKHNARLEQSVSERTAELQRERALLEAILDAMADGVIFADENFMPLYANRAMLDIMGFTVEELNQINPSAYLPDMDEDMVEELRQLARHALNRTGTYHSDLRMQRKSGDLFEANLALFRVQETGENPPGVVAVLRDVSIEKRLAAQKARFIANASHELRTPITNLKTRLYLIRRRPDDLARHLDIMDDVTTRMTKLIDDLLQASRFERGTIPLNRENVVAQTIAHQVVETQRAEADKKQITLTTHFAEAPLTIYADAGRIDQVLTNLIANAIHYTQVGGHIDVRCTGGEDLAGPHVVYEVEDNGPGIPDAIRETLFTAFVRGTEDGSGHGLGLSIAREIVHLHGGSIDYRSVSGEGTLFNVRLPLSSA